MAVHLTRVELATSSSCVAITEIELLEFNENLSVRTQEQVLFQFAEDSLIWERIFKSPYFALWKTAPFPRSTKKQELV